MALKTIQEEWDGFVLLAVCGQKIPPIEIENMKLAFYAGALVMSGMLEDACNPEVPQDDGGRYLEERRNEAMLFFQQAIEKDAERN